MGHARAHPHRARPAGRLAVPADAYYGVQTARALENFHISGVELRSIPNLIKAFAMVKMAAARANFECGQFSKEILTGIERACQELIDGKLHDEFRSTCSRAARHLDQHERERGDRLTARWS
jgi:aspartate ammonia-lyase